MVLGMVAALLGAALALPLPGAMAAPGPATLTVLGALPADSMLVRVEWSPAPRAQWYVVRVGADDGAWERTVEAESSPASLMAMMDSVPTPAFACVRAWNRHPVRGPQGGGERCVAWTVPADLAAPGTPGDVQVIPDTAEVVVTLLADPALGGDGGALNLTSLGDHVVHLLPVGVPQGVADDDDFFLFCVDRPDGVRGWVEAAVRADYTEVVTVPSPRFWREPGCEIELAFEGASEGVEVEFVDVPPSVRRLEVMPGDVPVLLFDRTTTIRVVRAPYVDPSA